MLVNKKLEDLSIRELQEIGYTTEKILEIVKGFGCGLTNGEMESISKVEFTADGIKKQRNKLLEEKMKKENKDFDINKIDKMDKDKVFDAIMKLKNEKVLNANEEYEKKVKQALVRINFTIKDLAEKLGYSPAYVSDVLKGRRVGYNIRENINKYLQIEDK